MFLSFCNNIFYVSDFPLNLERRRIRKAINKDRISIYLFAYFIFGCTEYSLLCEGFSLVAESGGYSLVVVTWAPHYSDFSCCGAQALGHLGFSG